MPIDIIIATETVGMPVIISAEDTIPEIIITEAIMTDVGPNVTVA